MIKLTKKQGEFFKIKNYSSNGKLKTVSYGKNYIRDLLYGEYDEDRIKKSIAIKLNK